jgi:hypothetical protein
MTVTGQRSDFVVVPRVPTEMMLYAAKDAALAEDAAWVWESMIENYEQSIRLGEEIRTKATADSPASETQGIDSL